MNERDMEGAFVEEQFNKLRDVIEDGFLLIAAELELNRAGEKFTFTTTTAIKSARQLLNKLREPENTTTESVDSKECTVSNSAN